MPTTDSSENIMDTQEYFLSCFAFIQLTPDNYAGNKQRKGNWMARESREKSYLQAIIAFFMSLSFALLKRWHLEMSFVESRANCCHCATSTDAFSISLACLIVTHVWMTEAGLLNQSKGKNKQTNNNKKLQVYTPCGDQWFKYL